MEDVHGEKQQRQQKYIVGQAAEAAAAAAGPRPPLLSSPRSIQHRQMSATSSPAVASANAQPPLGVGMGRFDAFASRGRGGSKGFRGNRDTTGSMGGPSDRGGGGRSEWIYGLTATLRGTVQALPMTSIAVRAKLSSFCSEVTTIQKYQHREQESLDATFLFPVPFQAIVRDFEATIDNQIFVGLLREKQPQKPLKDAEDPTSPVPTVVYLLEQERSTLKAFVPNLAPNKEIQFKVTYIADLLIDEDYRIRFIIPSKLTPSHKRKENDKMSFQHYKLEVKIELDLPAQLAEIESSQPTLITFSDNNTKAMVTLGSRVQSIKYLFIMKDLASYANRASFEIHEKEGTSLAAIEFYPPLPNLKKEEKEREKEKERIKDNNKDGEGEKVKEREKEKEEEEQGQVKKWEKLSAVCELSAETSPPGLKLVGMSINIFDASRLVFFCLLPADISNAAITLNGKPKQGSSISPFTCTFTLDGVKAVVGTTLHRLYAKALLRELENSISSSNNNSGGSSPAPASRDEATIKEIHSLSTKYGVCFSQFTSLVSAERTTAPDGTIVLKDVAAPSRKPRKVEEKPQAPKKEEPKRQEEPKKELKRPEEPKKENKARPENVVSLPAAPEAALAPTEKPRATGGMLLAQPQSQPQQPQNQPRDARSQPPKGGPSLRDGGNRNEQQYFGRSADGSRAPAGGGGRAYETSWQQSQQQPQYQQQQPQQQPQQPQQQQLSTPSPYQPLLQQQLPPQQQFQGRGRDGSIGPGSGGGRGRDDRFGNRGEGRGRGSEGARGARVDDRGAGRGQPAERPPRMLAQKEKKPESFVADATYSSDTFLSNISRLQSPLGFFPLSAALADMLCMDLKDLQAFLKENQQADRQWATALTVCFLEAGLGGDDRSKIDQVVSRAKVWLFANSVKQDEWLGKARRFINDHIEIVVE